MRSIWKVRAEIDMDASKVKTLKVCTNTKKKAVKLAEKELKKQGAFYVFIISCERGD